VVRLDFPPFERPTGPKILTLTPGLAWWDEHVSEAINQHDYTNMGRNNVLKVIPKLTQEPHNLKVMTPLECRVGGISKGEVCYGLYNKSWNKREVKIVPS
jgi:2,3-dihydroxybenzoate decarboxylase